MGGAFAGLGGAGLGARTRGVFSAAGWASRGDERPVSGASEPVSPAGEAGVSARQRGAPSPGGTGDHTPGPRRVRGPEAKPREEDCPRGAGPRGAPLHCPRCEGLSWTHFCQSVGSPGPQAFREKSTFPFPVPRPL